MAGVARSPRTKAGRDGDLQHLSIVDRSGESEKITENIDPYLDLGDSLPRALDYQLETLWIRL